MRTVHIDRDPNESKTFRVMEKTTVDSHEHSRSNSNHNNYSTSAYHNSSHSEARPTEYTLTTTSNTGGSASKPYSSHEQTQYSMTAGAVKPTYTEYKESKHYFRHINAQRNPVDSKDYHDQEATYHVMNNSSNNQSHIKSEESLSPTRKNQLLQTEFTSSNLGGGRMGRSPVPGKDKRERTVPIQIAADDNIDSKIFSSSINNLGT